VGITREALAGEPGPPLPAQHLLQAVHQRQQQRHVGDRVADLLRGQARARPVGVAGDLVELDVEQLEQVVLQPVAVGVGAGELARGARAVERRDRDAQPVGDSGHVEAREVEDLEHARVLEEPPRRGARAARSRAGSSSPASICTIAPSASRSHSCTRHSRSRSVCRPIVSVSTATSASSQVGLEQLLGEVAAHDLGGDVGGALGHRRSSPRGRAILPPPRAPRLSGRAGGAARPARRGGPRCGAAGPAPRAGGGRGRPRTAAPGGRASAARRTSARRRRTGSAGFRRVLGQGQDDGVADGIRTRDLMGHSQAL
jgi:hypothetical protein